MTHPDTPVQANAYAEAADAVREAAELIASAQMLLNSAADDMHQARAFYAQGDVARYAYELGDQGDEESGSLAQRLTSLALTLHQRGAQQP